MNSGILQVWKYAHITPVLGGSEDQVHFWSQTMKVFTLSFLIFLTIYFNWNRITSPPPSFPFFLYPLEWSPQFKLIIFLSTFFSLCLSISLWLPQLQPSVCVCATKKYFITWIRIPMLSSSKSDVSQSK